jgi:hypothetical protein
MRGLADRYGWAPLNSRSRNPVEVRVDSLAAARVSICQRNASVGTQPWSEMPSLWRAIGSSRPERTMLIRWCLGVYEQIIRACGTDHSFNGGRTGRQDQDDKDEEAEEIGQERRHARCVAPQRDRRRGRRFVHGGIANQSTRAAFIGHSLVRSCASNACRPIKIGRRDVTDERDPGELAVSVGMFRLAGRTRRPAARSRSAGHDIPPRRQPGEGHGVLGAKVHTRTVWDANLQH